MQNNIKILTLYFALVLSILPFYNSYAQSIPNIQSINGNINFNDGIIDPIWNGFTKHRIVLSESYYPNPIDFSGYWKAAYDKENQEFYILVEITDDIVADYNLFDESFWDADHLTIYFNLFRDKFPHHNRSNFFFNFYPYTSQYQGSAAGTGLSLGDHDYLNEFDKGITDKGWFIEIMISFKNITYSQEINYVDTIGFDVSISDNDLGYGIKKYRLAWNDPIGAIWSNPSLLGAIVLDNKNNTAFKPNCKADFTYTEFSEYNNGKEQITFTDKTITNDNIINWSWTYGDGEYSSRIRPSYTYDQIYENTEACLFITTEYGCNDSACKPLIATEIRSLSGSLKFQKGISDNWKVLAFKKEANNYFVEEESNIVENNFKFSRLGIGDYIFYALPSVVDNQYLPTYFVNEANWQESDLIKVEHNTFDVDIHLNPVVFSFMGTSSISGRLMTYQKGIPIILAGKTGDQYLYSLTTAGGWFQFNNLPFGEYLIYPEYPGLDNTGQLVNLSPGNEEVEGFDIAGNYTNVSETKNQLNYSITYHRNNSEIVIKSNINVIKDVQLRIYNSVGQLLYTSTISNEINIINTSNFNTHFLLVSISDSKNMQVQKILK